MSLSLYEVCIPSFIQALDSVSHVLDKGQEYCQRNNIEADSLLELSLHETMWPLRPQLVSVMHHSLGAIKGIQRGEFNPPSNMPEQSYSDFQLLIADTSAQISALPINEVNSLEDKSMKFKAGDFELAFSGDNFLLSFSLPNFYFHAATTYNILRNEGLELGKMDYLGKLRNN